MVDRPVGSKNHKLVANHLQSTMKHLGYDVVTQEFTVNTVSGNKTFNNIVATLNPKATRRFVLACHYDSKDFRPQFDFVGATDSAVPCALMLDVAHSLQRYTKSISQNDPTLQLIFFDGEEAFQEWTDEDSLYGSRRLSETWAKQPYPPYGLYKHKELDRIDVLVLLDLMGAANPNFYTLLPYTSYEIYKLLPDIEAKAHSSAGCMQQVPKMFHDQAIPAMVSDDHVPFVEKGVRIVHLIPLPFPDAWHTVRDNQAIIHYPTVENLATVMRIFTASYLNIPL